MKLLKIEESYIFNYLFDLSIYATCGGESNLCQAGWGGFWVGAEISLNFLGGDQKPQIPLCYKRKLGDFAWKFDPEVSKRLSYFDGSGHACLQEGIWHLISYRVPFLISFFRSSLWVAFTHGWLTPILRNTSVSPLYPQALKNCQLSKFRRIGWALVMCYFIETQAESWENCLFFVTVERKNQSQIWDHKGV